MVVKCGKLAINLVRNLGAGTRNLDGYRSINSPLPSRTRRLRSSSWARETWTFHARSSKGAGGINSPQTGTFLTQHVRVGCDPGWS